MPGGKGGSNNRTARGVELYFVGLAPRVVFGGGTAVGTRGALSSLEYSRQAGLAMGLPAGAASAAPDAHNTTAAAPPASSAP